MDGNVTKGSTSVYVYNFDIASLVVNKIQLQIFITLVYVTFNLRLFTF